MIQVGDLVKHKHIGGLGLVKSINTVVVNQRQVDTQRTNTKPRSNGLSTPMRVVATPSFGQNYS